MPLANGGGYETITSPSMTLFPFADGIYDVLARRNGGGGCGAVERHLVSHARSAATNPGLGLMQGR